MQPVEAYNVSDLRALAKKRLPRGIFEFVDRGTEDDRGVRSNRAAFEEYFLVPRVLVDVSGQNLETDFFGQRFAMPVGVSPTGAAGLLWHDGEIAIAKACARCNIPFTVSTSSMISIERVAEEGGGRLWFQLYFWPDRELAYPLIRRAREAGYEALIVTVDTPVSPNREYNKRNGFALPLRVTSRNVIDTLSHPSWLFGVMGRYLLSSGMPNFPNYPEAMQNAFTDPSHRSLPHNASLTWDDFRRIRKEWDKPLLIKGLVHPRDAQMAVECGADGVIVSNHGGRNLDTGVPPLVALPDVVEAVNGRVPVFLDGAITRGSDVVKALALGAKGVFAGRAPLWGVASAGEEGAFMALNILREETSRTLSFIGAPNHKDLNPGFLKGNSLRTG